MTRQANRLQDGLIIANGNVTLPNGSTITDQNNTGTALTVANAPTAITISGADFSSVNLTYTQNPNDPSSWIPANYNNSTDPYIQYQNGQWGIYVPGFGQSLYINNGTLLNPLTQWSLHPPLGSVAPTAVYTYNNPSWTFDNEGTLTLPNGSMIGETTSTVEIAPPSANPGQSLMIRPTASFNLSASGYIVPGQNLIITLTNSNNAAVDNTYINYTITGATAQQLGLASLTGHFPYLSPAATNPQSASIVLPIPLSSAATTFTLTTDSDQPAGSANITITVTNNNIVNNEVSHVHLIAGDPTTVDLYLGDDDQYVKIEKDHGNVVIGATRFNGSPSNITSVWTFAQDGITSFPNSRIDATDNLTIRTRGIPLAVTGLTGVPQGGWNGSYTNLATTGGSGTGLRVNASESGSGYIDTVTIIDNSGHGYSNGDIITISSGGATAYFTISINPAVSWTFNADGYTAFPDNTIYSPPGNAISVLSDTYGSLTWVTTGTIALNPTQSSFEVGPFGAMIAVNTGTDVGSIVGAAWTFLPDGTIRFPDTSVQTTAYTGGGGGGLSAAQVNSLIANSLTNYLTTSSYASIGYDLIPSANLTYNLGSTSSQWKSLYVGTSTIYLGGIPVSVVGSTLKVNGSPIAFNTSTLVAQAVSATIVTGASQPSITSVGTLTSLSVVGTVTANKFVGDGSSLTNITLSQAGNIIGTQTNVTLVAGSYSYLFSNTGTFTMPLDGDIVMTGTNSILSVSGTTLLGGYTQVGGYYSTLGIGYPGGNTQYGMTLRPAADNTNAITFLNAAGTNIGSITQTTSTVQFNMPNRPAFRVYGAGTTNNLSTTVNTNGILNGNNYAVDYQQGTALNTSTGVFTAPLAGLYSIHLVARVTSNSAGQSQVTVIKNNGLGSQANQAMWETGPNPSVNHFGVSTVAKLAAGDTLVLKVTLGSINFDVNDNWAVAYIG